MRSPAHAKYDRENPRDPTPAMLMGTLVHARVLEPLTVADRFVVEIEGINKRTKDGKAEYAQWEASVAGKTIVPRDTWDRSILTAQAIASHPAVRLLMSAGQAEVSLFWEHPLYGIPCKCRPDFLRDDLTIIDLKTTADASPEAFARTCARLNYHAGHAHYSDGVTATLGKPRSFILIAAEPEPPYGVAVYELDAEAIEAGARIMDRAALAWRAADEANWRPAYPNTIQPLALPRWATYQPENTDD